MARLCVVALIATLLSFAPTPAHAADGDYIRVYPEDRGGPVYRIVGGAPLYVSSWAAVGATTTQPYTDVSQAYFNSLPPYPRGRRDRQRRCADLPLGRRCPDRHHRLGQCRR
ncbi:hypothetical protein [Nocardioides sp. B-3]|uniref:hypothetical protein n=1 Tax=Nocardioides sp. B-3 TaxID=2895565 RepID=UPI0021522BDB|nr:hypothetical protein [Nocardioides sp. B-3]UUZ61324.1 hypothetical protein LP418_12490 [Nocardioides sp. B-3]